MFEQPSGVGEIVVKNGELPATVRHGGKNEIVDAVHVPSPVDTTGAGDLFAAGFLAARCRGRDLKQSLESGTLCAAEIITHFGARPEADLKELVAKL